MVFSNKELFLGNYYSITNVFCSTMEIIRLRVRILGSIGLVIFISILASQDEFIRHQFNKLYKRAVGKFSNNDHS